MLLDAAIELMVIDIVKDYDMIRHLLWIGVGDWF
jgi:hypothetical protein